jgi:hypothetical protein
MVATIYLEIFTSYSNLFTIIIDMEKIQSATSDEKMSDEANTCVEAFKEVIKDPLFDKPLRSLEESKRENLFFNLCTSGVDGLKSTVSGGLLEEKKKYLENYKESTSKFIESFKVVHHPEINWEDDSNWLHFYLNEFDSNEFKNGDSSYRIYLNTKLEKTSEIFEHLVVKFKNAAVNCSLKIPTVSGNLAVTDLNRLDRIVIYFDVLDRAGSAKLLSILEEINFENKDSFNPETPIFANRLSKLVGASVAQDPGVKGESFNTIRAKIFNQMYSEWERDGYVEAFDYEDSFQRCCMKNNVDSQEPWHNINRR